MRILVTGGAGFIGSNLCRRLLQDGESNEVVVIDDLSTGSEANLEGLDIDFRHASILNERALDDAMTDADAVVHLAALGSVPRSIENPRATHEANVTGTLTVLEAARRHDRPHVILASSSSVYGANPVLPKVETLQCMPMSPYAVSKLATEQYAMAYANCYELPVLPFRFFNVFGPRQMPGHAYAAVIPVFVEAALRGRPLPVNGSGEQSRDFTYVGTVVEAIAHAIRGRIVAGPTNLAFGTRTNLLDLIRRIEEQIGEPLAIEFRPERPGDVRHSQADNRQLRTLFPNLEPVPLAQGLRETVSWMAQLLAGRSAS